MLRLGSVLFLYDFYFLGQMPGVPEFTEFSGHCFRKYPTPPRHRDPFGPVEARQAGFDLQEQSFECPWTFTLEQLTAYLLTHSNTLMVTEAGEPVQVVRGWLTEQLALFFASEDTRQVLFKAWFALLTPRTA